MEGSNLFPVIATKRRHSVTFGCKLLELMEQPSASVVDVALEHDIKANLLFKWRRTKLDRKRSFTAALTILKDGTPKRSWNTGSPPASSAGFSPKTLEPASPGSVALSKNRKN